MSIHADQHEVDRLLTLMGRADSYDAERREVNTALTYLAVVSRVTYPNAKFLVLDDGDQGPYGYLYMIEDADGVDVLTDPDSEYASDLADGYDSWLYDNHRDAALPYLKDGTEQNLFRQDRAPWRGVVVDIDKILTNPPELIPAEPTITVPEWQPIGEEPNDYEPRWGDESSVLLASITINGLAMHLEAYEVFTEGDVQESKQREENFGLYHSAAGADGHFTTTTIGGRQYVLFATPYC